MNISVKPQHEKLIKQKVESGEYGSPDEVIDAALRLLDERDKKLAALRQDIQEGLNSSPGRPFDESAVEDVKRRGRGRLAQRQSTD